MQAMLEAAETMKSGAADDFLFFYARAPGPISDQIRQLTGIKPAGPVPQLVLVDVPGGGRYYAEDLPNADAAAIMKVAVRHQRKDIELQAFTPPPSQQPSKAARL